MSKKVVQGALFHRPLEVTSSPSPSAEVIPPPIACRPVDSQINWIRLLFSFKGRINRATFWNAWGLIILSIFVILGPFVAIGNETLYFSIAIPFCLIWYYAKMAVCVKRLHDINMSAWNLIILHIPLIGIFFWIVIGSTKGNSEPNKFGIPPPKGFTTQ